MSPAPNDDDDVGWTDARWLVGNGKSKTRGGRLRNIGTHTSATH
ncbi:hypothetical protein [Amycolatopsis sp. FU40]|nr:hypothetical protein [Amycolatopsis sp. FU40]